jgi:O-antigen ligase
VTLFQQVTAERFLVFFLGVSIFVSKSGIYAATVFLVLYFLTRLAMSREYRALFRSEKLAIVSVALYLLGLVVTVAYPGHIEDVSAYARKGAFLLLIPPLMFAFRDPVTRRVALMGLLLGFWLDFIHTFHGLDWVWSGGRVDGITWKKDQWSVMLALFLVFLVPITLAKHWGLEKTILMGTLVAVMLALLMAGGRGPWLGVVLAVTVYMVLQQRRAMLYMMGLSLLVYVPAHTLYGEQVEYLKNRVHSIGDLQENVSNRWRMEFWSLTANYNIYILKNDKKAFLLGSGPVHQEERITDFIEVAGIKDQGRYVFIRDRNDWKVKDAHNLYLDSLSKMGLIWTVSVLVFLFLLARSGWTTNRSTFSPWSAATALLVFLFIGVFYSILAHFASFALILLMSLALGSRAPSRDGLQ